MISFEDNSFLRVIKIFTITISKVNNIQFNSKKPTIKMAIRLNFQQFLPIKMGLYTTLFLFIDMHFKYFLINNAIL